MVRLRATFLSSVFFTVSAVAFAQEDGVIIDQDRPDRRAPSASERTEPAQGPHVENAIAEITPFVLRDVIVENSSGPPSAFESVVAPRRGEWINGAGLRALAADISSVYTRSDIGLYTIVIPEQDFANGIVRLQAIEGHISDVAITGDTDGELDLLRHYAAALTTERPLTRRTMERNVLLISDIPGLKTEVRMAPGADRGGLRLGLEVERKRFEYVVEINNRGPESLGDTRVQLGLIANGLTRLGDQTRLDIGADTELERYQYLALSHRQPIGHTGGAITGRLSALETDPANGVRGSARAFGLVYSYPYIRSYRENLIVSASLDGLNSDNAFLGDVFAAERIRAVRASASYSLRESRNAYRASGALSQGIDNLGARATDPAIELGFTKLNVQLGYTRTITPAWALRLAASGQYSGTALPASERFALGGAAFGRAFPSASLSGDDGLGASAELAWRAQNTKARISEVYGFVDGGQIWTEERSFIAAYDRDLASAGVGARVRVGERSQIEIEAAKSVDEPLPGADESDWRFSFGVNARF